jgi:hypothetical protein
MYAMYLPVVYVYYVGSVLDYPVYVIILVNVVILDDFIYMITLLDITIHKQLAST